MGLLYVILICNSGGACTQASDATFMTPLTCLSELSKLYYGTLQKNGKFYIRGQGKDTWLECAGAREDDGRIVSGFDARGHRVPSPAPQNGVTDESLDAQMRLQQSLTRLSYEER